MNSTVLVPGSLAEGHEPARREPTDWRTHSMRKRIRTRYAAERRFRLVGLAAVTLSAGFLLFLLATMLGSGLSGFASTQVALQVDVPAQTGPIALQVATSEAVQAGYGEDGATLVSDAAWTAVRDAVADTPSLAGTRTTIWVPASNGIDLAYKGEGAPEAERRVAGLSDAGLISSGFNWPFFTRADSTDPTVVGIWGAFKGSLYTMVVTLALAFPIGVLDRKSVV